jgi:hypothetical protein
MKNKFLIPLILIFLLIPIYTFAVEVYPYPLFTLAKDPRALGMAGAMTALGDSPTSAIFNPALMGEYNAFSLKAGLGFWPVDEENWNNFNKIIEYIDIIGQQEPPNDEVYAQGLLTGYANLGIGRLGLTLWGDADLDIGYNKYTNLNPENPVDDVVNLNVYFNTIVDANGAITLGLPIINLRNVKFNIGANLRVNAIVYTSQYVVSNVNLAGLYYSDENNEPAYGKDYYEYTANNYINHENITWNIRNWAIDLGAYLKLSENFALGISAQNVYAKWLGGEYSEQHEEGYFEPIFDSDNNLEGINKVDYESYSIEVPISPEEIEAEFGIPPLSLKAGAMLKIPTLNTRIAFDADLDNNFQPTLYRLGIEQPLLFFVVRGGAMLDTNFQPLYYTIGAGLNLLILRVDAGLGYVAQGSIVETIQNTMPIVASLSGSIQF